MMITVNLIELNGTTNITGSYNGKPFGVQFDEVKYAWMKDLEAKANSVNSMEELKAVIEEFEPLTKENYKELVEHAKGGKYLFVNNHTNKIFLAINGKVSTVPLPKVLVDKIITSVEKKIDVMPLVKCWARFIRDIPGRPKYDIQRGSLFAQYIDANYTDDAHAAKIAAENGLSMDVAKARATTKQVAITQEGLLVCYKVSREIRTRFELDEETEEVKTKSRYKKSVDPDTGVITYAEPDYVEDRLFEPYIMGKGGDEFYCGEKSGHFIRVGRVHYLDSWDKVSNPSYKGLHCGGLRYIQGYQAADTMTHNIFVDPMHIYGIAGLGTGNDGAMTVKQYFVHSSFAGPNKGIYHSSEYGKLTDKEYEELIAQAVADTQEKKKVLDAQLEEAENLK